MEENEIAIETGYKVSVAESLIQGMKNLLEEHDMDIEQDELDVIGELEAALEESKNQTNSAVAALIESRNENKEILKQLTIASLSEGLVDTDAARFATLAEAVSFSDAEDYESKLETIRESYFGQRSISRSGDLDMLEEEVEDTSKAPIRSDMSMYVNALKNSQRF